MPKLLTDPNRPSSRPSRRGPWRPVFLVGAILVAAFFIGCDEPADAPSMTLEEILDIRHPTEPVWTPDGSEVIFVWDLNQQMDLYAVEPGSGEPPRQLTRWGNSYEEISGLFWGAEGDVLHFVRNGRLYQMNPDLAGTLRAVFPEEPGGESGFAPSPDGGRVAFARGGDLHVRDLADGAEMQLTRTGDRSEGGAAWSPDARFIAYTVSTSETLDETHEVSGDKLVFRSFPGTPPDLWAVPVIAGGVARRIAAGPGAESSPRWLDAARLIFQEVSPDHRTRSVVLADLRDGSLRTLHRTQDEKWWSLAYLGAEPRPSPDGAWVALLDDSSGWDQLVVVSVADGSAHALTGEGEEARRYAWSPDGRFLAWDANPDHPGQRQLFAVDAADLPEANPRRLTSARGTNVQPPATSGFLLASEHGGFSPDGNRIVYQHAGPRAPADLFVVDTASSGEPVRLTNSLPEALDPALFTEGEFVRYPARDGGEVPGYLFVPDGLDGSVRHPAIVWVHGDGIAQNYDGWHVRRDYGVYHSFHQLLVSEGYVVFMPDYRGSIGYGRDFRQESYRDVGGGDYQDVAAAGEYLKTLEFVDPDRIGVWGLSYGGFMTMQALTLDPTLFAGGVNVAGVGDFRLWFRDPGGRWVEGRMGTPEENPAVYELGAPADRVDRIERPLLMLHGTPDVNVPYFESINLADRLLRAGKDFEFVTYPGEFHYFHREHVLRDAWTRVRRFFGRHLRGS